MLLKLCSASALVALVAPQTTDLPYCSGTTSAPETTENAETTENPSSGCNSFGNTLIQSDGSIRMLDSSKAEWCAFKKYSSYRNGDEIWYKPELRTQTKLICELARARSARAFCVGII